MPLSTQVSKLIPVNLMLRGGGGAGVSLRWTSILSRGNRNTPNRPDGPLGSYADFTYLTKEDTTAKQTRPKGVIGQDS